MEGTSPPAERRITMCGVNSLPVTAAEGAHPAPETNIRIDAKILWFPVTTFLI